MAGGSTGQQSEEKTFLGFPSRPEGDGEAVRAVRLHWYELAGEISGTFADVDRAVSGMQWSGDARRAFDAAWSQFSGHGTEASQHAQEMGDHLLRLGNHIEDAQHEWDLAMGAMVASTAIGIGLTFVSFGISDDVAGAAAETAVTAMRAACTAFEISLDAAVQVVEALIRAFVQFAVKFTWQFSIDVVSQETANVVQGRSLADVDLLQAAEFAGVSMAIPTAAGKVTIGGRRVLAGIPGAALTGAATDAAVQGLEAATEGRPFSVGEALLSGVLASGGRAIGRKLVPDRGTAKGAGPPSPTAAAIETDLSQLESGRSSAVRTVGAPQQLDQLFARWTQAADLVTGRYPGQLFELPDGTRVGLRQSSKSGGPTIDIQFPSGENWKVHVHPWPPEL